MATGKYTVFGALVFLGSMAFLGRGCVRSQDYNDGKLDKVTVLNDPDKYQRFEKLKEKLGVEETISLYDINSFAAKAYARNGIDDAMVQISTPLNYILTAEELDAIKAHEVGHLLDTHVDSLGALTDGELQQREYNADQYAKDHGYADPLSRALIKIEK